MVKNLPTVERSTKIRFGKNCTEDQAENTIVFNASDAQLNIEFTNSVYMTPLRIREDLSDRNITVLAYNQVTKEVMDSGAVAEDILNFSLEAAVINGNVTSNTVSFNDTVTSVTTLSNVGVANGSPIHTLDVGSTFNVDINGSNLLTVLGNTYIQDNLVVDGNMTVNGALTTVNTVNTIVKDPIIELGKDNVSSDIGIIMYRPNSNVAIGFREGSSELVLAYTESSSYGSTIIPRDSESLDVRVYGRVLTESNVGILNVTPTHTLDVGSNLFVDEFGSNILYVTGNTHTTDILSVGDKVGIKVTDPDAELHVEGNVYISSNLTVDENTFHVDATAHAVGIETRNPDAKLHVVGNVYVSSNLTVDEDTLHVDTTTHSIGVETKNPDANLHVVGNVYVSSNLTVDENTFHVDAVSHSVGVETKNPDAKLHVVGNVYVSSNLTVDTDTFHVDTTTHSVGVETKNPDANLHVVGNVYVSSNLTVDENTFHVDAVSHSVGIETKNPDANLHVVGNVYVSSNLTVDENTFHVDAMNHYVGVGTLNPDTEFHVVGDVYVTSNLTVDVDTLHVDATAHAVGIETVNPDANLHVVGNVYVSSDLTIDENTFHVDSTAHAVGIETKNPDAKLHVVGNAYVSSNLTVDENTFHVDSMAHAVGIETKNPDAKLHVVGNAYVSSNLTVDENTFHVDSTAHAVGIETKNPDANLHVVGNVYVSGDLTIDTDTLHVDATTHRVGIETKSPDANLHVIGNVYVSSDLTVDENTFHVDSTAHSVGIETKNPDANLHVVGNVYVSSDLTVDENTFHVDAEGKSIGVGTVTPDANLHVVGNVYVSSDLTVDTNTLHVDAATNRVGIKTISPSTELHVEGNAYVSSNIQASMYYGDGGLLSNVTLQVVSDHGNTTSNTIQFTNPTTALVTDLNSNVEIKLDQMASVVIGEKALANEDILVYDGSNWRNQLQDHTFLNAKAEEAIGKGDAVYASGTVGNDTFLIRKALANSSTTMPALGVAYQAFADNDIGLIVSFGRADGINTDTFLEGETVYVSNTVTGGLSNVKPYGGTDLIQNVGLVVKGHATTGIISVTGVGRANDIPNAPIVADESDINYVYVNDTNNDFKKILPTNLLTQLQTLQQVVDTGNTVSNTVQFTNATTGLITTSNLIVGSNISVIGLKDPVNKYLPMVGLDGFLEKSPVYVTGTGRYVISASEAEFLGNITLSGNTTILNSESVTIADRIFGVGANNSVTGLDSGFIIEHQDGGEYANVALIHHADEHRFSIGYTQNTFTDNHILHYEDANHQMLINLLGNVEVQHNLVVNETTTVAGDLTVGTNKLFVDVSESRIGVGTVTPAYTLDVHGNSNVGALSTDSVVVSDTTPTNNKTSGAVQIAGGLGVAGDIHATHVNFEDVEAGSVNITDVTAGALTVAGGAIITGDISGNEGIFSGDLTVGGASNLFVDVSLSRVGINTATPQAGLHVVGNAYVSSTLRVGEYINVLDTTEAFSTTTGALTVAGGIGAVGNVHAAQYYGDGSKLTGLVTTLEDVANNGNTMSNVIQFTNANVGIVATGNIHAEYFIGNGSKLTGLVTTLEDVANNGNTMSNVIQFTNEVTGLVTTGKIGVSTVSPNANLHVVGNVHVADTTEAFSTVTGAMTITGGLGVVANVYATQFHGDGSKLTGLVTTLEDVANNGNTMSNVIQFTNEVTGLVTTGKIGVSTVSPDANLHVVGNVYVADVVTFASGLVTNKDQVAKKTYSYSGTISAAAQPYINVNFTSNVFYSKISAQLVDGDEEVSTMILEVSGGSKSGVSPPTKNISIGTKNVFGNVDNTNPWDEDVLTTGNRVAIRPLGTLANTGEYHVFVEYVSANPDGSVTTIDEDVTSVITFGY